MAPGSVNPVAAGAVGVGLIFIWSGMKGSSITKVFQSLVQGQKPDAGNDHPVSTPGSGGSSTSSADTSSTGAAGGTVAQNQAIAKQLAASYGWDSGAQWDALVWVWQHESSWNVRASNGNSGPDSGSAYGIPQAKPGNKMASEGADWRTNASTQIKWGLKYIKQRYGSPVGAKAFWQSHNWY